MSSALGPKLSFTKKAQFTDFSLDYSDLEERLSPFQIEKLSFLYNFFDATGDGNVDWDDIDGVNEKLRNIAGWSQDDPQYLRLEDNSRVFLECLLDQVEKERGCVEGLEERSWEEALAPRKLQSATTVDRLTWLRMWARLCHGSAGIDDFPIWVQLLPRVFFNVIVARFEKEKISTAALRSFYSKLNTNLTAAELDRVTEMGFKTATADGAYDLDLESYKLLFSNFLLGKTIYGPGKYIFGCFDNRDMHETYKVNFG